MIHLTWLLHFSDGRDGEVPERHCLAGEQVHPGPQEGRLAAVRASAAGGRGRVPSPLQSTRSGGLHCIERATNYTSFQVSHCIENLHLHNEAIKELRVLVLALRVRMKTKAFYGNGPNPPLKWDMRPKDTVCRSVSALTLFYLGRLRTDKTDKFRSSISGMSFYRKLLPGPILLASRILDRRAFNHRGSASCCFLALSRFALLACPGSRSPWKLVKPGTCLGVLGQSAIRLSALEPWRTLHAIDVVHPSFCHSSSRTPKSPYPWRFAKFLVTAMRTILRKRRHCWNSRQPSKTVSSAVCFRFRSYCWQSACCDIPVVFPLLLLILTNKIQ